MSNHILPDLPYAFDALEPHIDAQTMEIHHGKHHKGYVDKLNAALAKHAQFSDFSLEKLLANLASVPEDIRTTVRNNGGGHYNHSLFWKILGGKETAKPEGELGDRIDKTFGSLDKFKDLFSQAAAGRFGSGWAWLSLNALGELTVHSTPNQDNPLMEGLVPILGLDVWEHAYYLKYHNRRPDYINAFWNVVNWREVAANFAAAQKIMKP